MRLPRLDGASFTIGDVAGTGGSAVVYRATMNGNTPVAVKVLKDDVRSSLFDKEADNLSRLPQHPNIVQPLGETYIVGRPALVFEEVRGPNLRQLTDDRPLSPKAVGQVVADTAKALDAAHAAGIVHGDLKPSNIAFTAEGQVKVLDWGLSRRVDDMKVGTSAIVGTPGYIAPEVMAGYRGRPASDIFALGVIAHNSRTGDRLIPGIVNQFGMKNMPPEQWRSYVMMQSSRQDWMLQREPQYEVQRMLRHDDRVRPSAFEVSERFDDLSSRMPGKPIERRVSEYMTREAVVSSYPDQALTKGTVVVGRSVADTTASAPPGPSRDGAPRLTPGRTATAPSSDHDVDP